MYRIVLVLLLLYLLWLLLFLLYEGKRRKKRTPPKEPFQTVNEAEIIGKSHFKPDIDEIPLVYESSDAPSFEEEEDEELPVSGESEYATGIDFERVLEALAVIHRNASSIAERQRAGETLTELEGTRLMETLRSDKVRSSTIDDIVRNRFEELYVPSDGRDK